MNFEGDTIQSIAMSKGEFSGDIDMKDTHNPQGVHNLLEVR